MYIADQIRIFQFWKKEKIAGRGGGGGEGLDLESKVGVTRR